MLGCGLAALAGVLLTPLTCVDPNMGVARLVEATAGLTKAERTTIGQVLVKPTAEQGIAAILAEHDFVCDISGRIVVLHQGRLVPDGGPVAGQGPEPLVCARVGYAPRQQPPFADPPRRDIA